VQGQLLRNLTLAGVPLLSGCLSSLAASSSASNKIHQPVLLIVEAGVKETYDDNIYTYEFGPLGHQSSWITQGRVRLGIKADAGEAGTWTPSYTWEGNAYHEASEESHQKHHGRLEFHGERDDWSWKGDLQHVFTDGSTVSPVWTGPGGSPAVGAPEVRNRRRNFILDHTLQATWRPGLWWTRASYRGQGHDFMTRYSPTPGYQNYDDRSDFSLGLDFGRALQPEWDLFAGARIGQEDQGAMPGTPIQYDNQYLRLLAGTQGHPFPWVKVDAEIGPDFRDFTADLPPGEMDHRTEIAYRASLAFRLSPRDHLIVGGKQYLFPSSAGAGMMREGIWETEFQHDFADPSTPDPRLSVAVGFRVHEDDFFPANRRDRVYTPRMEWKAALYKNLSGQFSCEYSWAESDVPNTAAREFDRYRASLSLAWQY
jgi:hypothetical protein